MNTATRLVMADDTLDASPVVPGWRLKVGDAFSGGGADRTRPRPVEE